MPAAKKTKHASLSAAQVEIVGQFNDLAFENPKLSFDKVVRKEFRHNPFPDTPNGRKFRAECKAVFDLERRA